MKNKLLINKIKNAAELAMAAYGYFHLVGKKFKDDREKYGDKRNKPITLHDILDSTYKGYKTPNHKLGNPEKLDGDMTPTQVKRFLNKYDILIHQPNTESGFLLPCLVKKESKPTQNLKQHNTLMTMVIQTIS